MILRRDNENKGQSRNRYKSGLAVDDGLCNTKPVIPNINANMKKGRTNLLSKWIFGKNKKENGTIISPIKKQYSSKFIVVNLIYN